jgi:hypothetical protein
LQSVKSADRLPPQQSDSLVRLSLENNSNSLLRPFVAFVLVALAACGDAPTEPGIDCSALSFGAPLTHTVTSAAALRPALEDARDRILPTLSAPPAIDVNLAALETAVTAADRAAACTAFNTTVNAFNAYVASAPSAESPDLEVLRLTLQFARTWITAS